MIRKIDPTNRPKNFEVDVVDPESNSSAGDRFDTNGSHVSQYSKNNSAINLSNVNRGRPHYSNLDLSATDSKSILRS